MVQRWAEGRHGAAASGVAVALGRAQGGRKGRHPGGSAGPYWLHRLTRPNSMKTIPSEFKLILDFVNDLENCTRRFWRNFDVGIFPKLSLALQGFYKNTICHAMQCILGKINLEKIFICKVTLICNLYALLCWQNFIL
jgi:hypothetical protein